MIKRTFYALTLLLILCVSGIQAQNTKFSKEEFRNRQKEQQRGVAETASRQESQHHGNGIWENCGRCDSGTYCSRRTGAGICAEIQTIPSGQENLSVAKSGNALPQRTAKRFQTRSERSGKEKIRDTDRFFLPKIWKTKIFAYLCTAFEKQGNSQEEFWRGGRVVDCGGLENPQEEFWRGGRVVDCGGLENRCTARYPGFESLSLR